MLHRKIEDNTSKRRFFFFRSQTPTSWASSNLLQMPNNCRMVGVEFFVNFACSCKRIGFDEPLNWALSTSRDSEGQGSQACCSPQCCSQTGLSDWTTSKEYYSFTFHVSFNYFFLFYHLLNCNLFGAEFWTFYVSDLPTFPIWLLDLFCIPYLNY